MTHLPQKPDSVTLPADRFPKMDVPITLTGEEWFALLARTVGKELSLEGAKIYNRASGKLRDQLLAASDASLEEVSR